MASTSFLLSNPTVISKFSGAALPPPRNLRVSASFVAVSQAVPSLYEVMGIPSDATSREIKSAYRKLARVLHPDAAAASDHGEEFIRVHAAYVTLSDPEKRAEYDQSLVRRWPESVVLSFSGTNRRSRNWETDQCW